MRALVVYAHPRGDSFVASLRDDVVDQLKAQGAELREHDLYRDGFNPVLSKWERQQHLAEPELRTSRDPLLKMYVEDLVWCDSLIFVYPTWWSAQPTMLKGWMDRVLINGIAWTLPPGSPRIKRNLKNVRRIVVVTTHGSSKLANAVQGESGKRILFRGLRVLCHVRCRTNWIAIYNVDKAKPQRFVNFKKRVRRRISRLV